MLTIAVTIFIIVIIFSIIHPPPSPHLQLAKMTPEELERLRARCKKFGLPIPGESACAVGC